MKNDCFLACSIMRASIGDNYLNNSFPPEYKQDEL